MVVEMLIYFDLSQELFHYNVSPHWNPHNNPHKKDPIPEF
jgi:hypothetical protein